MLVLSWNVCGGITPGDGSRFLESLRGEVDEWIDVIMLQECGDASHLDLGTYVAHCDGEQRGNSIILC